MSDNYISWLTRIKKWWGQTYTSDNSETKKEFFL